MTVKKPKGIITHNIKAWDDKLTRKEKILWSAGALIIIGIFIFFVHLLATAQEWVALTMGVSADYAQKVLLASLIAVIAIIYFFPMDFLIVRPFKKLKGGMRKTDKPRHKNSSV